MGFLSVLLICIWAAYVAVILTTMSNNGFTEAGVNKVRDYVKSCTALIILLKIAEVVVFELVFKPGVLL